jgi:hypothetical protein
MYYEEVEKTKYSQFAITRVPLMPTGLNATDEEMNTGCITELAHTRVGCYEISETSVIIIIIIIIIISFIKGIYTCIPETNNVPKEYNVAANLSLLCMVPISQVRVFMYFYISTFRSMCAVPNLAVFCSSLMS